MNFESIVSDSVNFTRETLLGKWTRWVILILLGLPMALMPLIIPYFVDVKKIITGLTIHWELIPWAYIIMLAIIVIFLSFFITGYTVRIYRGGKIPPEFNNWGQLLIEGIKLDIITTIWFLPALIILLLGVLMVLTMDSSPFSPGGLGIILFSLILAVLAFIFAIVAILFLTIGAIRFSRTGKMSEGWNYKEIRGTIGRIGWGNYIVALVILLVIGFIFNMVTGLIGLIPFVGRVLQACCFPFIMVFFARFITKVYEAGELPPDSVQEHKNKGNDFFKQGRYDEALNCYGKAIDIDPTNTDVLFNIGMTLRKLGKTAEADSIQKRIEELKNQAHSRPGTEPVVLAPNINPPGSSSGFCRNCGSELKNNDAGICPSCGMRLQEPGTAMPEQKKNPVIAALCSFFIPGLGQVYNGEVGKGFAILIGTLIGAVFLLIPGIIVWIIGIYDAYKTAGTINSGKKPCRSTSTTGMILFGVFAVFLIFVFVLIGLAMLFGFFAMMGATGHSPTLIGTPAGINDPNGISNPATTQYPGISPKKSKSIAVTAIPNSNGTITVTNNGGPDMGDLSFITVSVNGVVVPNQLNSKMGSKLLVPGTAGSRNRVMAVGTFRDGTSQMLLDVYIGGSK